MKTNINSVKFLQPGMTYIGREGWWLKVEEVKVTDSRVVIESTNGFNEPVKEHYHKFAHVEVIL